MSISDFPPVSLDKYIANTNKGPDIYKKGQDIYKKGQDIYKIYKRFDDSYDPNNPEAVRDAMIKTAVKTGVGAGFGLHTSQTLDNWCGLNWGVLWWKTR